MGTFLLRKITDESNPTLSRLYGKGSTKGSPVYMERDGDRTKFILILCQGGKFGCDGIDKYQYEGFLIDPQYYVFHPGTRSTGYSDPLQGRPTFFPNLNFTFSGICYLEVFLPKERSPQDADTVPDGSEVFMRGLKVEHYDLVDGRLQSAGAAFSANNILCGLDNLIECGQIPLTRFQLYAETWKDGEARCDEALAWDRGADHGGVLYVPRFDCHMGVSQSVDPFTNFNQILARAPGMKWFDANGGLGLFPDLDRASVHTLIYDPTQDVLRTNILRRGLSITPQSADKLFNFYVFSYRDLSDENYKQAYIDNIFYNELRDAAGGLIQFPGVPQLGLMYESLAQRIGWYTARTLTGWYEDGQLIFPVKYEVKGQMDSYHVVKNDNVDLAHDIMAVNGEEPMLCSVIKEAFEARGGERSFLVQRTSRTQLYRDDDHGVVQGSGATFGITTSDPLPDGIVGIAYSVTLQASGGTTPYLWSVTAGTLPDGLALSSGGVISGTPTLADDFSFTVQVLDANGLADTKVFNMAVAGVGIVTSSPLPNGTDSQPYSQSIEAIGGVLPYTWSLDSGAFPTGLSIDAAGLISGTPTILETQTANVKVVDSVAAEKIKAFEITIVGIEITTDDPLPIAGLSRAYIFWLQATGGTLPYTWTLESGALPDGINLNPNGRLNGGPSIEDLFSFEVRVTDALSATVTKSLSITVLDLS